MPQSELVMEFKGQILHRENIDFKGCKTSLERTEKQKKAAERIGNDFRGMIQLLQKQSQDFSTFPIFYVSGQHSISNLRSADELTEILGIRMVRKINALQEKVANMQAYQERKK